MAHQATSGPNIGNTTGPESTTSKAASASTLNDSLSSTHSEGPWAVKWAREARTTATAAVTIAVSFGQYDATMLMSPAILSVVDGCNIMGLTYLGRGGGTT
uniref:Uncharacterized protein n=1 Tax=Romanomermis culicivorax TaxID=13658 RepID=A0A915J3E6_ROMCU